MYLDNCHVICSDEGLLVGQLHQAGYTYIGIGALVCQGAEIGVSVDSRGRNVPVYRGLSIVGGEGVTLEGTGIRVGVGGSMNIRDIRIWVQ